MRDPASGLLVGDRVVVRYRLGDRTPDDWRGDPDAARSDVTGFLVDDGDPLILNRNGTTESIPRAAITSVRLLSSKPVRNSEIRSLEHAAALAWPGIESAWIDGWLVRAGGGYTRRANSALPLEPSAHTATSLPRLADWYRRRELPLLLSLPERLITPGSIDGVPGIEVQYLSADIDTLVAGDADRRADAAPSDGVRLDGAPPDTWLAAYARGTDAGLARQVVCAARGPVTFASLTADSATDSVGAIGRGAVTESPDGTRWLGLTALWTAPKFRRTGLAGTVAARLVSWGAAQGATSSYVQVESTNRVAGAWYRRWGFGLHHTSRYLSPITPES